MPASPRVPHLAFPLVLLAALAAASPAAAQWTRITQVPASIFYSVWVNGDRNENSHPRSPTAVTRCG